MFDSPSLDEKILGRSGPTMLLLLKIDPYRHSLLRIFSTKLDIPSKDVVLGGAIEFLDPPRPSLPRERLLLTWAP